MVGSSLLSDNDPEREEETRRWRYRFANRTGAEGGIFILASRDPLEARERGSSATELKIRSSPSVDRTEISSLSLSLRRVSRGINSD